MTLEELIAYGTIIFWFFPPVRQYRRDYFYFFLTLALLDPIVYVLVWTAVIPPNITYIFGLQVLVMTLIGRETIRKYYAAWLFLFALLLLFSYLRSFDARYIMLVQLLALVYMAMKVTIRDYSRRQKLHVPHIILLIYIVSLFTKIMFYLLFKSTGYLYFYLTTVFQVLVAIYFTFARLDDFAEESAAGAETVPAETNQAEQPPIF